MPDDDRRQDHCRPWSGCHRRWPRSLPGPNWIRSSGLRRDRRPRLGLVGLRRRGRDGGGRRGGRGRRLLGEGQIGLVLTTTTGGEATRPMVSIERRRPEPGERERVAPATPELVRGVGIQGLRVLRAHGHLLQPTLSTTSRPRSEQLLARSLSWRFGFERSVEHIVHTCPRDPPRPTHRGRATARLRPRRPAGDRDRSRSAGSAAGQSVWEGASSATNSVRWPGKRCSDTSIARPSAPIGGAADDQSRAPGRDGQQLGVVGPHRLGPDGLDRPIRGSGPGGRGSWSGPRRSGTGRPPGPPGTTRSPGRRAGRRPG